MASLSPLAQRVATAAVLVPATLAALFLLPPLGWGFVVLAIVAVAAHEWAKLVGLRASWALVAAIVAVGAALLLWPGAGFGRGWPAPLVRTVCGAATLFWLFVAPTFLATHASTRTALRMSTVGALVLVAVFVAIVELQARSPWLVLAAMAIVWIADTAAYFAGRAFGRVKLAPSISPGKTREGVYGALVAVGVYAAALTPLAARAGYEGPANALAIAGWIAFALVLAGVSVVGDLFESLMKREAGVKDSGALLPGHGGVLDRVDALLAAMPAAALAASLFLRTGA